MKLSIWSCDSPDFLITPGIRILGTGADTLNSVQASYFERFHWSIFSCFSVENGVICIKVFVEWMDFDKINV